VDSIEFWNNTLGNWTMAVESGFFQTQAAMIIKDCNA
jgi:hypothetical protein